LRRRKKLGELKKRFVEMREIRKEREGKPLLYLFERKLVGLTRR